MAYVWSAKHSRGYLDNYSHSNVLFYVQKEHSFRWLTCGLQSTPGAILIIIRTAKFYFMFKKNIILFDGLRVVCKALQGLSW